MGYSYNTHVYTSGAQEFPVHFTLGYINKQDVFVNVIGEVDGEGSEIYRDFEWIDDATIRVTEPLTEGDVVKIQRVVSKQELMVDFTTPGSASRDSLNAGFKQLLMAIHEMYDGVLADKALVTTLPRDIEVALAFISTHSDVLLTLETQGNEILWTELLNTYISIHETLAKNSNYSALAVGGANKAIEQAAIAVSNAISSAENATIATTKAEEALASAQLSLDRSDDILEYRNTVVTKAQEVDLAHTNITEVAVEVSMRRDEAVTAANEVLQASDSVEAALSETLSAKDQALSAFNNFSDVYLGAFDADPTQDLDGSSLEAGDLYYDLTNQTMKVYSDGVWRSAYVSAEGTLLTTSNLSDVSDVTSAKENLGLGSLYPVAHLFRKVGRRLKYTKQVGSVSVEDYADYTILPEGVSFYINEKGRLIAILPEIGD